MAQEDKIIFCTGGSMHTTALIAADSPSVGPEGDVGRMLRGH